MIKAKNLLVIFFLLIFLIISPGCKKENSLYEKHPDFSKNVIDVSQEVKELKTDLLLGQSMLKITGNYLLVCDIFSLDEGFHFYNKKTLKYVGSGGRKGQGPGEIISYNNVEIIPNEIDDNTFFVFDYSQITLYKYHIDSLLHNKQYLPYKVIDFRIKSILNNFSVINDSIFIGIGSYTTSNSSFIDGIVKLNINTNTMEEFGYQHPKIKEFGGRSTHSFFGGSKDKNRYVQGYYNYDLITICDIDGNLVSNVYGTQWKGEKEMKFKNSYFGKIGLYHKYIVVNYTGHNRLVIDEHKRPSAAFPKKFLIFDLEGNYLKTLDIGEEIRFFCLDEENNRLFLSPINRNGLSYLDLNGLLD